MNDRMRVVAIAATTLLALSACQAFDSPTAPRRSTLNDRPTISIGCAVTDWDALKAEADSVMTLGSPAARAVLGKIDNLIHQCSLNNDATAKQRAWDIVQYVLAKWNQGTITPIVPPGSTAEQEVIDFINHVLAAAGLEIQYLDLDNAWIVNPNDSTQTFVTNDGKAALTISGSDVDSTTLITAQFLPPSDTYLDTDLDQYPRYYRFDQQSLGGQVGFNNPVVIAICVLMPNSVPQEVFDRLRIAAQHASGFEVTDPAAPPVSLSCGSSASPRLQGGAATGQRLPGTVGGVAPAIIGDDGSGMAERGGVGGLADNFSDFGVVDPQISARGGVGGLADNFRPRGGISLSLNNPPAGCSPVSAERGTQVATACRPTMSFKTQIGLTPLDGIPVTFTVIAGGGLIGAEDPANPAACTPNATTATVASAVGTGEARVCWQLGPNAGANQVTAQAGEGGDASSGTYFVYSGVGGTSGDPNPNGVTFNATGLQSDPSATATGGTFGFDNLPHGGSGTCTDALVPALSYNPGGANAPVNVGSYTLTVTCGDGGVNFTTATAQATITIDAAASNVSVSCPSSVTYDGTAQTPCAATVTGVGGLSQSLTVTYANNTNVGTATADASYAGDANHAPGSGSATFAIDPAASTTTVSCPASVTYTGSPLTPCSASVTGVGGLNQSLTVSYSNNTNAGTASADASFSGDANHSASNDNETFQIGVAGSSVVVSCPSSVTYTGGALIPCTASVTGAGGLNQSVAVSYANNTNAGTATASATFGGDANHSGNTGSATFTIARASSTTSVSCPASVSYTGSPLTPCTAAATGAGGLSQSLAVSYSNNTQPGTATASATFAGDANHTGSNGSATFTIIAVYVQVDCFASPIYSVMPSTKSAQNKGSNLPIKCTLKWPNGSAVTTAKGDLAVYDLGTSPIGSNPQPSGAPFFTKLNAFTGTSSGNYSYGLNTGLTGFIAGHAYFVRASWNDGSTTTGYFRLK